METSEFLATVEALHGDARRRGLLFQTCEDEVLQGRRIRVGGKELLSFGSCSYLGLEYHPALIAGVKGAVERYGTQFASSRGYLSAPQYDEFEDVLERIFDAYALCVQTTTLAHQAMFDVFLTEKDAIVLDHQVHFSVQRAATLARAAGARVELVKHEELDRAVDVCRALAKKHRTVWFATDGITSMYGDLAPVGLLERILDVADNVRLYVDDAHGMTWTGKYGRGSILSRMPERTDGRMVVATSLAKAFAAGGAVLVFRDREERERVRMCGGPMVFSGPLQPPLLGAALASARLHLTDELASLQGVLAERVRYTNAAMLDAGLPLLVENEVPIMFIRCGLPRVANAVAARMAEDGIYVNVSMYPAVPMKRGGIRVGITATHSHEEIDRMVDGLARHVPAVLADEGVARSELDDLFRETAISQRPWARRAEESLIRSVLERSAASEADRRPRTQTSDSWRDQPSPPADLVVETFRSIHAIRREAWDSMFGGRGSCSWEAMALVERTFRDQPCREHNWDFYYIMVRDGAGELVCATFCTVSIQKDDMLMREAVSRAVEERRKIDPYFLSSRVTMTGSGLSEGDHLFVDRGRPWRAALRRLLEQVSRIHEEAGSDVVVFRDLAGDDPEMDEFFLSEGYLKVPNLDSHRVVVTWRDDEELLASMSRRTRKIARSIIAEGVNYALRVWGANEGAVPGEAETRQLHGLYLNVARRKLRYNAFELPQDILPALLGSRAWEIVTMTIEAGAGGPPDGRPVAFWAAHRFGDHYAPLFCGLDYVFVESHGVYRQMLYRMLQRARAIGASQVHLGMDAEIEKQRWAAVPRPTCMYVQARGDWNGAMLREIVAEVGVDGRPEARAAQRSG